VLFRGLVLHGLVRVWARTRTGVVASVVLTALLFAALHSTQVLTNDLSRCAALLLPRTSVSALIGTATSNERPTSGPKKPGGVTPTIVNGTRSIVSDRRTSRSSAWRKVPATHCDVRA